MWFTIEQIININATIDIPWTKKVVQSLSNGSLMIQKLLVWRYLLNESKNGIIDRQIGGGIFDYGN